MLSDFSGGMDELVHSVYLSSELIVVDTQTVDGLLHMIGWGGCRPCLLTTHCPEEELLVKLLFVCCPVLW
jgi:hypothetical protein